MTKFSLLLLLLLLLLGLWSPALVAVRGSGFVSHRKEAFIRSCHLRLPAAFTVPARFTKSTPKTLTLGSANRNLPQQQLQLKQHSRVIDETPSDRSESIAVSSSPATSTATASNSVSCLPSGLYRPFATHAWNRLLEVCGSVLDILPLDDAISYKETRAPGVGGETVRITIQAARGKDDGSTLIQYARYALLETVSPTLNEQGEEKDGEMQSSGIQVLNMVIFPTASSGLPVFGADFVALPGNKHLLLLDAQPMMGSGGGAAAAATAATTESTSARSSTTGSSTIGDVRTNETDTTTGIGQDSADSFHVHWKDWYDRHNVAVDFPWSSELPEQILPYVSKYALWTRLGSGGGKMAKDSSDVGRDDANEDKDPITHIQGPGMKAFVEHLEIYLNLIQTQQNHQRSSSNDSLPTTASRLGDYVQYRLDNDPARPMLKRLYGEEWTEHVLHTVLFPLDELKR